MLQQQAIDLFEQKFGYLPSFLVQAPGRVNLIGEHTDYNEGFVFPIAIDKAVYVAFAITNTGFANIVTGNLKKRKHQFSLRAIKHDNRDWLEYVKGVAFHLQQQFGVEFSGIDAVVFSDVPMGAGLSSSAALELAFARALSHAANLLWQPEQMAVLAQRAENQWVGVNCGIMDQLISALGKENCAVLIDCRDLSSQAVTLPKDCAVVVMDTSTRRGLVESAYNERRQQCEQAANTLGLTSLRDATLEQLMQASLPSQVKQRARHVISENQRTLDAKQAMLDDEPEVLGELFNQSHASLRDDFEVTNKALDVIVELAQQHPACYGARMTGAGFGGCAVALIKPELVGEFCSAIEKSYHQTMELDANVFLVRATDGVNICSLAST